MQKSKVKQKFEECWKSFVDDYPVLRKKQAFLYEADLQLHLACRLREELQSEWVHQEYRIRPSEVDTGGRPLAKGISADIAIHPEDSEYPYLIVEIKWWPLSGSFEDDPKRYEEWLTRHKKICGDDITAGALNYYTRNFNYLSKYVEKTGAYGYLCIIDEWNENIKTYLKHFLKTPRRFRILAEHFNYHAF